VLARALAEHKHSAEAEKRAQEAVLKIARLIGRQMAREEFERRQRQAANDDAGLTLTPSPLQE
jgi:hypothetical protein